MNIKQIIFSGVVLLVTNPANLIAQTGQYTEVLINPGVTYQTVTGFGASLAFYENWLTAHPKKAEIYQAIFGELSLDILRVRNAYGYDNGMVGRVKEFAQAANNSLGKPIDILVSSWSPPAYLKSNNSTKNGGTLKYSVSDGKVSFQYAEFARWWNQSLDNYNANGIYPAYISIQNEPDYTDTWETCLLRPSETVNSADTIAGYNKALDAVYDTLAKRSSRPRIIGPETVGIGYNSVENYVNALDVKKLDGIAHHLYHGVDKNNPYASTDFSKVGNFHPEIPHFQTEYSGGDWFSLAGLIYKTFNDEKGVAYLYWDLIWTNGGLVSLENPWNSSQWQTPNGYTKTKEFYAFRQFSAYIHPGWKRISVNSPTSMLRLLAFLSAGRDSATFVAINTSVTTPYNIRLAIPGYQIGETAITRTSGTENGEIYPTVPDSVTLKPKSITTVAMKISAINTGIQPQSNDVTGEEHLLVYPNPFRESATLRFTLSQKGNLFLSVYDYQGKRVLSENMGYYHSGEHQHLLNRGNLKPGIYLVKLEISGGKALTGRLAIADHHE